jgi:hypothetical protein
MVKMHHEGASRLFSVKGDCQLGHITVTPFRIRSYAKCSLTDCNQRKIYITEKDRDHLANHTVLYLLYMPRYIIQWHKYIFLSRMVPDVQQLKAMFHLFASPLH